MNHNVASNIEFLPREVENTSREPRLHEARFPSASRAHPLRVTDAHDFAGSLPSVMKSFEEARRALVALVRSGCRLDERDVIHMDAALDEVRALVRAIAIVDGLGAEPDEASSRPEGEKGPRPTRATVDLILELVDRSRARGDVVRAMRYVQMGIEVVRELSDRHQKAHLLKEFGMLSSHLLVMRSKGSRGRRAK